MKRPLTPPTASEGLLREAALVELAVLLEDEEDEVPVVPEGLLGLDSTLKVTPWIGWPV